MSRFPELLGLNKFAAGVVTYTDHFGGDHAQNTRIVVPVRFGRQRVTTAIVDTGAPWCILNPALAVLIAVEEKEEAGNTRLTVRGDTFDGELYRIPVTLTADEGDNLTIDSTVFVPVLQQGVTWPHPNFLGLDGFLHRMRFAVDPAENAFYFGIL